MFTNYISNLLNDPGLIYAIIMSAAIMLMIIVRNLGKIISQRLIYSLDLILGLISFASSISYLLANNTSYTEIAVRFSLAVIFMLALRFWVAKKRARV